MFIDERKREHPCSLVSVHVSARLLMNRISPKENRKRKKEGKGSPFGEIVTKHVCHYL